MKRIAIILILLFSFFSVSAKYVRVSILAETKASEVQLSSFQGEYYILNQSDTLSKLNSSDRITFTYKEGKIQLKKNSTVIGAYKSLKLLSFDSLSNFRLNVIAPKAKSSIYENNLEIKASSGILALYNEVYLDNYVAGVVESEIGFVKFPELLKVQGIICRTYALKHLDRHKAEGFELCDKVHCQVYHGKNRFNMLIKPAVDSTANLVIIDAGYQLIESVFHANCGGQTMNSEDIWSKPRSYLRSVRDTFCVNEKQAHWEKVINKTTWVDYLSKKTGTHIDSVCVSSIPMRTVYMPCCTVSYKDLRTDFKLRSTFFDIEEQDNYVVLKGRGFGHGVGMCQEGAIRMAQLGYTFEDIVHHYYTEVRIDDVRYLDPEDTLRK